MGRNSNPSAIPIFNDISIRHIVNAGTPLSKVNWKRDPQYANLELPDYLVGHDLTMRFFGISGTPQLGMTLDVALNDSPMKKFSTTDDSTEFFSRGTIEARANIRKIQGSSKSTSLQDEINLELDVRCKRVNEGSL